MLTKFLKNGSFIALLTLTATTVFAQIKKEKTNQTPLVARMDSTKKAKQVLVETRDGSTFRGTLLERRDDTIVIETASVGQILLSLRDLKSINEAPPEPATMDNNWFKNPYASRYFLSSTGFGLRKGEGYYQNIYVFLNHVNYGFTDNFSLGAGFESASLIASGRAPVYYYVAPKLSFPMGKNFNLGIGALVGSLGFLLDGKTVGNALIYSVATFGSRENNLTGGAGVLVGGGSNSVVVIIGGQTRIGRKFSLVTELYSLPHLTSRGALLFFDGARYMTEGFAFDFGAWGGLLNGSFIALPYVSIAVPFGNKLRINN